MPPADSPVPYGLRTTDAAQALAHTVLACYPAAFCVDPAGVRPLQVGIHREIALALDVPRVVVREMMRR